MKDNDNSLLDRLPDGEILPVLSSSALSRGKRSNFPDQLPSLNFLRLHLEPRELEVARSLNLRIDFSSFQQIDLVRFIAASRARAEREMWVRRLEKAIDERHRRRAEWSRKSFRSKSKVGNGRTKGHEVGRGTLRGAVARGKRDIRKPQQCGRNSEPVKRAATTAEMPRGLRERAPFELPVSPFPGANPTPQTTV